MGRELIVVACVTMLQACAQTFALKSGEPRHTSAFDGDWSVIMKSTAPRQSFADWHFNCDRFIEPFFIRVSKGVVSGYLETDENYSFRTRLDSLGVFNAVIPVESYYRYRKKIPIERSTIALFLSGDLSEDDLNGRFVIGDTRMNLRGCVTKVQYVAI